MSPGYRNRLRVDVWNETESLVKIGDFRIVFLKIKIKLHIYIKREIVAEVSGFKSNVNDD